MDEKQLAQGILDLVGGSDNVEAVTHCASRLRFTLKDTQKADADKLEAMDGVLGVVEKGGQVQVEPSLLKDQRSSSWTLGA